MAITIPIVSEFRDAGLKKAEAEIQGFGKRAGNALKNLSVTQVAAAGAAIGAFGVKAVMAFQNVALEAGRFSDATGLAVEDASRWIEVSGDLGVESSAVQSAIQRMNKTIGEGNPIIRQLGIEIARTADGTVDANATFQRAITTIGGIEDPTLRAAAAQKVFGKGYAEISELMTLSASELASALGDVSDAKVIDEKELVQARKFRDAMDGLKDSLEDVQIEIGSALVPALSDLARGFEEVQVAGVGVGDVVTTAFDALLDRIGLGAVQDIGAWQNAFDEMKEELRLGGLTAEDAAGYIDYYASRVKAATGRTADLEMVLGDVEGAYKRLTDTLSDREGWRTFDEARWVFHSGLEKTEEVTDEFIGKLADTVVALEEIPEETKVALLTELKDGEIAKVERWLNLWRSGITVPIRTGPTGAGGGAPKRALGGPVSPGTPYLVGEKRPEIFVPSVSGRILPNTGGYSESAPMVVNINTSADPNEVARAIETYRRRNGALRV